VYIGRSELVPNRKNCLNLLPNGATLHVEKTITRGEIVASQLAIAEEEAQNEGKDAAVRNRVYRVTAGTDSVRSTIGPGP
jgi:hypothetical protein